MKLTRLSLLLLLLFVAQQLLLATAGRSQSQDHGKRKERARGSRRQGKIKEGAGGRTGKMATQGKFVNREKAECNWAVGGEETGTRQLRVHCKQEGAEFWCEFTGKPSVCDKYGSDAKNYWKQISRALKKQSRLCSSRSALLKSKVCRRGPREAHLSISKSSLFPETHSKQKPEKTGRNEEPAVTQGVLVDGDSEYRDPDEVAAKYCNEGWSSLCKLMVKSFNG